ncbi:ABC transporter permease [Bosea sp. Root381]|uniref:ABC transporter permease n=1 Tax=Bosea sp. Root381 TaxID=1736524 RepID=UPI0006FB1221|nr:ABC transporter permease [Bosea sp. Root381]KRE06890.1 ABC transporter permease [Bosea sp. Root381]
MADITLGRVSAPAEGRKWRPRVPYWLLRLAQILPVVFLIVATNFFLLRLAPGDMADVMAGEAGAASMEYADQLRQQFGLDAPLLQQFLGYAGRILQFDLGWSFRNGQSVASLILARLPATVLLLVVSLTLAALIGSALGALAALSRSRAVDFVISTLSTFGFATPLFWLGLMLIVLFSVHLGWLPSSGMYTLGERATGFALVLDYAVHLVLPVLCLSTYYLAIYARLMRTSVKEVKSLDFVRTARAKGASRERTIFRHILPNAVLPVVTLTGLQFGALFSGSITVEAVFAWPGLGQLALGAVASRDLNLLLGILFVSSIFVLLVNFITDLSYRFFDPRVELSK